MEEAKYGVEIPQTHESTDPRICRKLYGNRGVPKQYREIDEFGLSEHSRHWSAFGNAPMV